MQADPEHHGYKKEVWKSEVVSLNDVASSLNYLG